MGRQTLTEARPGARTSAVEAHAGRFRIELITPGWGASGYYSAEVLEAAGAAGVFPAGTHMYLDHPTRTEQTERPVRSVRDLAAVLTEAAVWDATAQALVAEVAVFGQHREVLAEMADDIGCSVVAVADVETGEAEGRRGRIVRELVEGKSVDFVTHAGRGGRIVEILESAGSTEVEESRNVGQWVESRIHRDFTITADDMFGDGRLTREERISLSAAIGDALTAFVGSLEASQPQLYARDLWEDPQDTIAAALEAAATHVPSIRPGSHNPNPEEIPMGHIQVDEAVHTRAVEEAGRVPTLESERDTAVQRAETAESERDSARAQLAESARTSRASEIITAQATEAGVTFTALESRGLLAGLPLGDDGALDEAAFTTAVEAAVTEKAATAGAGTPRGFGQRTTTTSVTAEEAAAQVAERIKRRAGTFETTGA